MNSLTPCKRLAVVTGDTVNDVVIQPGTTTRDVLDQLGLPPRYMVSARDGLPFGDSETLYHLPDGGKVYASAPAVVGQGVDAA